MPLVSCSEVDPFTVTQSLAPSNDSAPPFRPAVVHVAPLSVPVFPLPETSATVGPLPASNEYAATSPPAAAAAVELLTAAVETKANVVSAATSVAARL